MQTPTIYILLAAALPLRTTLAQNTTRNFTSTCNGISQPDVCCPSFLNIPYISSPNASVESVGSVPFHELPNQDPWYLSVLVNDTGPNPNGDRFRYTRESFLSVPENASNTSVFLYQFSPLNATKLTNGSSCAGVFSEECMSFMQETLSNATISEWRPDNSCPDPFFSRARLDRLLELCGKLTPNGQLYSRSQFVVANDNCSYPSLPSVELPDNYQTPARGNSRSFYDDQSYRSGFSDIYPASTYDQFVSQVVPFAVVSSFESNQNNAVQLVCVTPNKTQPGSQVPEGRAPWESAATGWQLAGKLAMGMAGVVGLLLAL